MKKVTDTIGRTSPADRNTKIVAKHTAHIKFGRHGVDDYKNRYIQLKFRDGKKRQCIWWRSDLTDTDFQALNRKGAHLVSPQARSEFRQRLQEAHPTSRVTVATRIGWHGSVFLLPERQIRGGEAASAVVLDDRNRPERYERYQRCGSLKSWMKLAQLAVGNDCLMLFLAAAFSGPVAALLKKEQIGLLLVGPAETGKTSILIAAGSVWGCHRDENLRQKLGFVVSLNATPNDLEDAFIAANHTLLAMDESQALAPTPKEIADLLISLVFRLEGGSEKGRKPTAQPLQSSSAPFLLSSNSSLTILGHQANRAVKAEHHGRLIGIPMPDGRHGAFGNLHGYKSVADVSQKIRTLATSNFGFASTRFLSKLVRARQDDEKALLGKLTRWRSQYLRRAAEIDTSGNSIARINEKMATVYASARFAIEACGIPWTPSQVRKCLIASTRAHLRMVGADQKNIGVKSALQTAKALRPDYEDMLGTITSYLKRHQILDVKSKSAADIKDGAGIWKEEEDGSTVYLMTDGCFQSLFPRMADVGGFKKFLREGRFLKTHGKDRKSIRYSIKRKIAGQRRQVLVLQGQPFQCLTTPDDK